MLILSASNVVRTQNQSQSLQVANKLKDLLSGAFSGIEVADLREYPVRSCTMCEACVPDGQCVQADRSNELIRLMREHDTLVIVCPHYAGVPSQLMALFEKVQEHWYLEHSQGREAPGLDKFAVIAHGGMTEGYEEAYKANLLTPLLNIGRSMGCTILNDDIPESLCFGVKAYRMDRDPGSVCVAKDNDTEKADRIIGLLAGRLMKKESMEGAE